jgi:hypothetical protein
MSDIQTQAETRIHQLEGMLGEMNELGRMRSDFVLEHFVAGQHDTPGRQRAQVLAELQSLYFAMADLYDDMQIAQIDLTEIEGDDPREQIQRRKLERGIAGMAITLNQRVKEIDHLLEILTKLPRYTADELEKEEPIYWAARLSRQAYLAPRDPGGNLDAILQMATTPGLKKPTTPISPDRFLLGLGLDVQDVAAGLVAAGLLTEAGAARLVEVNTPKPQLPKPKRSRR